VVLNADFVENEPLGHAEWVKFIAAFFNREAIATAIHTDVTAQYTALTERVRNTSERPTVLTNVPWQGTWYVPGGNGYTAQMLADAGATYLWSEDESTVTQQLSFETVYDQARDADFWINVPWNNVAEGLAADERFADFAALQQGQVYANNARVNEHGGNDYWENGVTHPHLLLADLIAIFHPDVLPEHDLIFYRQLDS
jgi:iron complex transport system substrate-binding protein